MKNVLYIEDDIVDQMAFRRMMKEHSKEFTCTIVSSITEFKKLTQQKNVESIMVLPAGGDASETIDIVEAFADLSIKRLLITRADTARRFGSIIAAAAAHKLAFCHIGTSASIVNSLEPMSGGVLAQLLLRYQSNVSSPRLRGDRGG